MHGYLFSAQCIRSQIRSTRIGRGQSVYGPQVWTACDTAIVYAGTVDRAREIFETWLCRQPAGENPLDTRIEKVISVKFEDQLLTETGNVLIDWPALNKQYYEEMQARGEKPSEAADDLEQGYWLDVNTDIRPGPGIDSLHDELPEDIRSGLNWSADRQFFFLITVLNLPPAPVYDPNTDLPVEPATTDADVPEADTDDMDVKIPGSDGEYPQMADKVAAVAVRARNAAVAIWLWRKYSVRGKVAQNPIRVDPWYGAFGEGDK